MVSAVVAPPPVVLKETRRLINLATHALQASCSTKLS
jgi:hypothetical protein